MQCYLLSQSRAFVSDCPPSCSPRFTSSVMIAKRVVYLASFVRAAARRSILPPMSPRTIEKPVPNLSVRAHPKKSNAAVEILSWTAG